MTKHLFHSICVMLVFAGSLWAHDTRPILVEITETGTNRYSLQWRVPNSMLESDVPEVILPETCPQQGDRIAAAAPDSFLRRKTVLCPQALAGQTVEMRFPVLNPSLTTLFRVKTLSGEVTTHLLGPQATAWIVPARVTRFAVARDYALLGLRHIMEGFDHLLFVLGLLLLVQDRWMLLKTITSFTVAHSITLAIATLGYASAPLSPLNAAIALSVFFLGPEIMLLRRGGTSFTIRHPWVVAFAFGLLHGFGFASGLRSVGLPSGELPFALLLFNVGVEAGQLACVALVLLLERSFRTLEIRWPRWAEAAPGYLIGSLGAFWAIQRTVIMFSEMWR